MEVTNLKKKNEIINKRAEKPYKNPKICYICKGKLKINMLKIKKYCKAREHYHYTSEYRVAPHSICN